MEARTVRDFSFSGDPWGVADRWAKSAGWRPAGLDGATRIFKKGSGFWAAPRLIRLSQNGSSLHLEAWTRAGFFVRLMALFIIPKEMGLESGGFRMVVPRKLGRTDVNHLLEQFGQPPIA